METKRRTEIKIETHETTIIRVRTRQTANAFCELCRERLPHFSVRRAAAVLRLSETAVFKLAESGQIHSTENARGELFICGISITKAADEINRENDFKEIDNEK